MGQAALGIVGQGRRRVRVRVRVMVMVRVRVKVKVRVRVPTDPPWCIKPCLRLNRPRGLIASSRVGSL